MQNLTEDQRAQVKFIEEVVRERSANRTASAAETYVPAVFTCSLTNGPDGASFEGSITYGLGIVVSFRATEFTVREGLPIAMVGGGPVLARLPWRIMNKVGTFRATGWGPGGTLQMQVDGVNVFWTDAVLAGLGLLSWRVEGKVAFSGEI